VILGVQISKKKGRRTESEDPILGEVWKIKNGDAFSSKNIPFQN